MGGRKQRAADLQGVANKMQDGQARSLDALTEYETFRELFLPEIRRALVKGLSGTEILEQFKPIMMARLVQIGGTGGEAAALNAIKEILDRTDGKVLQKTENEHKFGKLRDEELDAMLATKLAKATKVIEVKPEDDE